MHFDKHFLVGLGKRKNGCLTAMPQTCLRELHMQESSNSPFLRMECEIS